MTDMSGWGRGDQKRNAVAMTEQDARILADMVAEVFRNRTNEDQWTQYKRLVQLEGELARAAEEIARRDQAIAGLNEQLETLKSLLLAIQNRQPSVQNPPTWTPPVTWQLPPGGSITAAAPPPSTMIYQNPSAGVNYEVPRQTSGE